MRNQTGYSIVVLSIIVGLLILGMGGYYLYSQNQTNSSLPTNSPSTQPIPSLGQTANWKTYTNKTFGFSFSYPPDLSVQYDNGTYGSIDEKIIFLIMQSKQGAYCNLDGPGTIDLQEVPAPTEPLKIAASQAKCGCDGDSPTGYTTCTKVSDEKVIPSMGNTPIGYQFYLQEDSFDNYTSATPTASKIIGPFRAYFFPESITMQGTESIGIYFKLEKQDRLNTFNQILSTFKFTQ